MNEFRKDLPATPSADTQIGPGKGNPLSRGAYLAFAGALAILVSSLYLLLHGARSAPPEHVLLRLQGATSLAEDLVPKLSESFLRYEFHARATGIRRLSRDSQGHSVLRVWADIPGRNGRQAIDVYSTGTESAFNCLAARVPSESCDIGLASRPLSARDEMRLPQLRRLAEPGNEYVVALDGIAVIVNPSNPVRQLSLAQLRDIYSGKIRNWKDVGGRDAPIERYGRDRGSGTLAVFAEQVLNRNADSPGLEDAVAGEHQVATSALMVQSVLRSPNAIGFVSSAMVKGSISLAISDGSGPAVAPSELTVVTEEYPLCRRLFLYAWRDPGSIADAFLRFAVSKPGQDLVESTPFVELTPRIFPIDAPPHAPPAYRHFASDYLRVALSFHFLADDPSAGENGIGKLDNLARMNISRLRSFLAEHSATGDDILLIGYSERGPDSGAQMAQKRAEEVAVQLRGIGVHVPPQNILNFDGFVPLGSSATPQATKRNRRVEVWIRKNLFIANQNPR